MAFARQHRLKLRFVDKESKNTSLPGEPLTADQLGRLILKSRKSGIISMKDAHQVLRNNFHTD
jgi:hypothetical protein